MIALSGHGYPPTTDGLAVALEDLVEADQIIAALLAEPDSTRVLQRASEYLERARWRKSTTTATTAAATFAGGTGGNPAGLRDLAAREAGRTVLRNCWSCRHSDPRTTTCSAKWTHQLRGWLASNGMLLNDPCPLDADDVPCPPDADGCPGWSARDPQPHPDGAAYVGDFGDVPEVRRG